MSFATNFKPGDGLFVNSTRWSSLSTPARTWFTQLLPEYEPGRYWFSIVPLIVGYQMLSIAGYFIRQQ